jgi:hypothetical protein
MENSPSTLTPFVLSNRIVGAIQARVRFVDPNLLQVNYVAQGAIGGLKTPSPTPVRRADRLWEHTCFEAFIRSGSDPSYYEFNFSPSGEWAAYAFHDYRDGGPIDDDGLAPEIIVRRAPDRLELDAVVRLDRLPAIQPGTLLRIGLSAVIEANDGTLSYWALNHPAAKPDFHHPDSFLLELPFPSQGA